MIVHTDIGMYFLPAKTIFPFRGCYQKLVGLPDIYFPCETCDRGEQGRGAVNFFNPFHTYFLFKIPKNTVVSSFWRAFTINMSKNTFSTSLKFISCTRQHYRTFQRLSYTSVFSPKLSYNHLIIVGYIWQHASMLTRERLNQDRAKPDR